MRQTNRTPETRCQRGHPRNAAGRAFTLRAAEPLTWGSRGRRFKFCQPDNKIAPDLPTRTPYSPLIPEVFEPRPWSGLASSSRTWATSAAIAGFEM